MKRLLLILILTLNFQSWTKANDSRDFQIEGMSLGDSLLDHFSIEKIKKNIKKNYYKNIPNFKYLAIEIQNIESFNQYFGIQIHVKKNDSKYIIQAISGYNYYQDNINECYDQMELIKKDFNNLFKNLKYQDGDMTHSADPSGKSRVKYVYYYFDNKDVVSINCYDWSDEVGYWDNLDVSLDSKDFYDAISQK